MATEKL